MFIESLTPDQLVRFAYLVSLSAVVGGVLGSLGVSLCRGLFDAVSRGVEKSLRESPSERVASLCRSRRLHLTAAMTARRELRKLRHG